MIPRHTQSTLVAALVCSASAFFTGNMGALLARDIVLAWGRGELVYSPVLVLLCASVVACLWLAPSLRSDARALLASSR